MTDAVVLNLEEGVAQWPERQQLLELMPEDPTTDACDDARTRLVKEHGGVENLCKRLGSDTSAGLGDNADDLQKRISVYGGNWFKERELTTYLQLIWGALQDHVIILLIFMATISLLVTLIFGHGGAGCGDEAADEHHVEEDGPPEWLESFAIYMSVFIIVNVAAATDYKKERMFRELSKSLETSNKKSVVRGGKTMELPDREIVVGDIVQFNAHNQSVFCADGILLSGSDVKVDESSLTGEPDPLAKSDEVPFLFAGTVCTSGSGRMLVVSVGEATVGGRIKMAVYGDDEEEKTPLFEKLDTLAGQIGKIGTAAAVVCFLAMCIMGQTGWGNPAGVADCPKKIITYVITAITILAVAVPEGLPLAVTLSLAFSSQKMYGLNNLVKTLDSCETMGSATTICTDKTGTLTANRMTVRGLCLGERRFPEMTKLTASRKTAAGQSVSVPEVVQADSSVGKQVMELVTKCVSVCTMDESTLQDGPNGVVAFKGNPTECALLQLARGLGVDYEAVRSQTKGRAEGTLDAGKPRMFTSARKMMSWAVPHGDGFRVYAKGASEIVLDRCTRWTTHTGDEQPLQDAQRTWLESEVIQHYAQEAMRTIGLAYKDVASFEDLERLSDKLNADGTPAFEAETDLTLIAITAIEDPLRDEVPPAIAECYAAGIDVRMVTGDNLETAVAIAKRANILNDSHFEVKAGTQVLKKDRAMEGREFRSRVYRTNADGEQEFNQAAFDEIWPHLRVLARSSPDDKLTLANGLNKSMLFADKNAVKGLEDEGITIFPDRQVVAMTGDGTNDAPALKRADVGFAMGISGTQIAKDAADIILLDDNFASIVTAAKWGRNVYDSISKFLQFQLTVNIVALTVATVGAFKYQESPIAAVQMLWVNLIMDSLASLALATEPPDADVLHRPPVNRSQPMITGQMWSNMLGQSFYAVVVLLAMLFLPEKLPSQSGEPMMGGSAYSDKNLGKPSEHYTFLFNAFVMMALFNEVNCRKLYGESNIFKGIARNPWFLGIWGLTVVLQIVLCQAGSRAFRVWDGGLNLEQWAWCLAIGAFTLVWQQVINLALKWNPLMNLDPRVLRSSKRPLRKATGAIEVHGSGDLRHVLSSGQVASYVSSGDLKRVLSSGTLQKNMSTGKRNRIDHLVKQYNKGNHAVRVS